eukprot:2335085-Amphidinium_carterae.1
MFPVGAHPAAGDSAMPPTPLNLLWSNPPSTSGAICASLCCLLVLLSHHLTVSSSPSETASQSHRDGGLWGEMVSSQPQ